MTTQPRLIGGRYELGELIGYGGMAEVHRGRDNRLGRDVAIKVLRADLARDHTFLARFRREAQSAAGLNHPSIVSVYDTGEDAMSDGTPQPYIVMEYVEGRTLRDVLKSEGRLPARRVMEIGADICSALDFSHRNGIVHRDIKPANVMITTAGAVKVMDFGIARAVADTSATVTQTANVIGTAQYLSPEQARGEAVDARSDVYSTGCLLYELATGVPPFQGDSPVAVAYQHVREDATLPSSRVADIPRSLDSIVMKALAKNQLNRYQSAGDMGSDLQRALANQPVAAEAVMTDAERTQFIARTPPPVAPLYQRRDEDDNRRRAGLVWLAVVLAMLLVIGGVVALIVFSRGDNKATPMVAVPSGLIGKTPQQDQLQFKGIKLNFAPNPNQSTTNGPCDDGSTPKTDGVVCKLTQAGQPVSEGQQLAQGSTVNYQTYMKAEVTVPYVVGLPYNKAVQQLTAAKLTPKRVSVNSSQPADQVIGQNPSVNAQLPPNGTVTLKVSTGKVVLPNVRNKQLSDARATLNHLQFTNIDDSATKVTTDPSLNGIVYDESPVPGNAYPTDTTIRLTVYQYQAPPPTCTTPPPSSSGGSSSSSPPPSSGASSPGQGLPIVGNPLQAASLPPCTS